MMNEQSAKKDQFLKAASETLHMFLDQIEALQNENKNLKVELQAVKAAASDKVTLLKVAAASNDKIDNFVSLLVNHGMLPEEKRQKCAAALADSPDNILDIAASAIRSSEAPIEAGYGIKSASDDSDTSTDSNDLWSETLKSYEVNYSK